MADTYIDMREIVLRAAYPEGIRVEEYSRAINIIGSITIAGLAGHPAGARNGQVKNGHANGTSNGQTILPLTNGPRPGSLSAEIVTQLGSGPKTLDELAKTLGHPRKSVMHLVANQQKKKLVERVGPGTYALAGAQN